MSIDTAMERLRAANPAPDTRLLRDESDDLAVLLAATWRMSTNAPIQEPPFVESPQRKRPRGWVVAAAAFAIVMVVGIAVTLSIRSGSIPPVDPEPTSTTTSIAQTTTSAAATTTIAALTTTTAPTTPSTTLASFVPTDPSVLVNGGWLAYECRGEGSPTVVVDHGLADDSRTERDPNWMNWGRTIDMIADTNTVCVYGRRGVVGSEPVSADPFRTAQDQVDDLNVLIDVLGLETPVILAGHAMGGYNIRLLASQHPEKVAGLVFVDAFDPGIAEFDKAPDPFAPEWIDFAVSDPQAAVVTDLGDLPVYVLTATRTTGQFPDGTFGDVITDVPDWWFELQDNLLALSTNSIQQLVEASQLNIYWAKPEAVVEAVAWVTAEVG